MTSPEQQLWCAVIEQAITDAISPALEKEEVQEVRNWFTIDNADFVEACSLAGLCPERTRRYALTTIEQAEGKGIRKRRARTFEHDGQCLTIRDWSRITGLSKGTIIARIKRGLPMKLVLSTKKLWADGSRGVGENFQEHAGTGAGSVARDRAETEFSQEDTPC
jgi:hypothetical protein